MPVLGPDLSGSYSLRTSVLYYEVKGHEVGQNENKSNVKVYLQDSIFMVDNFPTIYASL